MKKGSGSVTSMFGTSGAQRHGFAEAGGDPARADAGAVDEEAAVHLEALGARSRSRLPLPQRR